MKMTQVTYLRQAAFASTGAIALVTSSLIAANPGYTTNNLVSDVPKLAKRTDGRVVNSWGIAIETGRFFVAENGSGLITIHNPDGAVSKTSILVPLPGGATGGNATPTGIALNPGSGFPISFTTTRTNGTNIVTKNKSGRSTLLFATEDGTIGGWNSQVSPSNGVIVIDNSGAGAIYKGLATFVATNGTFLYAANFGTKAIERYDTNFTLLGTFSDTTLTDAGLAPFNVKAIQHKIFVTFAKVAASGRDDEAGAGNGAIDIFNADGTLVRSFATGGDLNSPWGLAFAPTHFSVGSGNLLVGNFGDGRINIFNIITGESLGPLTTRNGDPITISGLWSLNFGRDPAFGRFEFEATGLFYTAGINEEADGVIGIIRAIAPFQPPIR